jgi:hypothetical protein
MDFSANDLHENHDPAIVLKPPPPVCDAASERSKSVAAQAKRTIDKDAYNTCLLKRD